MADKKGLTAFLAKTFEIVSDAESNELITWSEAGDSFVVLNPDGLAARVLPRYFKHNNFASFVRQLNIYGFRKITNATCWEFRHESFLRGRRELLVEIKRKKGNDKVKERLDELVEERSDLMGHISFLESELRALQAKMGAITRRNVELEAAAQTVDGQVAERVAAAEERAQAAEAKAAASEDRFQKMISYVRRLFSSGAGGAKERPAALRKRRLIGFNDDGDSEFQDVTNNMAQLQIPRVSPTLSMTISMTPQLARSSSLFAELDDVPAPADDMLVSPTAPRPHQIRLDKQGSLAATESNDDESAGPTSEAQSVAHSSGGVLAASPFMRRASLTDLETSDWMWNDGDVAQRPLLLQQLRKGLDADSVDGDVNMTPAQFVVPDMQPQIADRVASLSDQLMDALGQVCEMQEGGDVPAAAVNVQQSPRCMAPAILEEWDPLSIRA